VFCAARTLQLDVPAATARASHEDGRLSTWVPAPDSKQPPLTDGCWMDLPSHLYSRVGRVRCRSVVRVVELPLVQVHFGGRGAESLSPEVTVFGAFVAVRDSLPGGLGMLEHPGGDPSPAK
jgi:hypothetical protein